MSERDVPAGGAQSRVDDVCRAALIATATDGAAASLFGTAGFTLVTATGSTAAALEQAQATLGEGPSWTAFDDRCPVIVPDLHGTAARGRWPGLVGAVTELRVGRLVALPIFVGGIYLGVLSLHSAASGQVSRALLSAALFAADAAALALLDAETEVPGSLPLSALGGRLDYRVHQATGMVMGQTGLSAHDALTRLRARAFSADVPLQRLAADVIAHRVRFDQEDG